jgi:hypothetical protein
MTRMVALALALSVAAGGIASATEPTTKAECEKAKMTWDDAHGKCVKK